MTILSINKTKGFAEYKWAFFPYDCIPLFLAGVVYPAFVFAMQSRTVISLETCMEKIRTKTIALTISALVIALYVTVMYTTQSFAFGAYQIRIATCLYSLSYLFPFLVVPLGLANFLSNFLGGLGFVDIIGGTFVGIITSGSVYLISKFRLPMLLVIPIIILGPGLLVPLWLSPITGVPYPALVISLCIGQTFPAILGYVLIKGLSKMEMMKI